MWNLMKGKNKELLLILFSFHHKSKVKVKLAAYGTMRVASAFISVTEAHEPLTGENLLPWGHLTTVTFELPQFTSAKFSPGTINS